jgi:hypothetical protein
VCFFKLLKWLEKNCMAAATIRRCLYLIPMIYVPEARRKADTASVLTVIFTATPPSGQLQERNASFK